MVLQMDELDPLIASLEAFIKEQQTPFFIPENEVIRYPVSCHQKNDLAFSVGSVKGIGRSPVQESGLPRLKGHGYESTTFYTGNGRPPHSGIGRKGDSDLEIERELTNLRNQVRDLQLERENWRREAAGNLTDGGDCDSIEEADLALGRKSHYVSPPSARRITSRDQRGAGTVSIKYFQFRTRKNVSE